MKKRTAKVRRDEMPADVSGRKGWRRAKDSADLATVRLPTTRITINLDSDLIGFFKAEALRGGPPYQVGINQALRLYLHERESRSTEGAARAVMAALDEPAIRRKILDMVQKGENSTHPDWSLR